MKRILKRMAVMTLVVVLLLTTLVACGGGGDQGPTLTKTEIKLTPLMVTEYIPELDSDGNPMKDAAGNPIYKQKLDENNQPMVDENGNPVYEERLVQAQDAEGNLLYENKLTGSQLNAIADMLISANKTDYTVQSMLIAAANGFGMAAVDSGANDPNAYEDLIDEGVYTPGGDKVINIKIEDTTGESLALRMRLVRNVIFEANSRASQKLPDDLLCNDLGYRADANGTPIYDHNNAEEYLSVADVRALIDCFKVTITPSEAGFFDTILLGIGIAVGWITENLCFGSYLAGICVFAIIIEILMLPFAIKQQKNSIRQAKLRPKEMAIRNKYKGRNDQATMQKMQQEIQEFYQKEHYSPYSGCLSLIIQLPIIMALYNIIIDPLHYMLGQSNEIVTALRAYAATPTVAGGAGMSASASTSTISLMSEVGGNLNSFMDGLRNFEFFSISEETLASLGNSFNNLPKFTVLGENFGLAPALGNFNILLLVPILTFAAYFLTSKLNRKLTYRPATNSGTEAQQMACSNSMMDITMPLMSTIFTFMVPALVGVYWIFRSFVGLLKQFILSKVMPLPVFTAEDYKAAEREMKNKQAHINTKSENGAPRAVRSLHYIDDEDFEDTRERGLARKAALEEKEREEQARQEKKKALFGAPVKENRTDKDAKADEKKAEEPENKAEDSSESKENDTTNTEE